MLYIDRQSPADIPAVEALLDRAFGARRHEKTAQRLRDGRMPAEGLAFVARDPSGPWGERVVATLTFWNVSCGPATPAVMLGPIAVDSDLRSQGLGRAMILRGLDEARARGHGGVILVGDAPYYGRFGFTRDLTERLILPGPVDPTRFLGLELVPGALSSAAGFVRPTGTCLPESLTALAAA